MLGGQLLLPQPAYQMDMQKKQVGRAFADWLDFIGGNMANGVGGEGASLTSWTKSPLLAIRVLQDPGAYSSTATLRFELKDDLIADDHAELSTTTASFHSEIDLRKATRIFCVAFGGL